jgi:hypothetical protein
VERGLVACFESSFRHYLSGEAGVVEIESQWTARKREQRGIFFYREGTMKQIPAQSEA